MMEYTAANFAVFNINLYDVWLHYFSRMWADIARAADTPIIRIHEKRTYWLGTHCDCWNCRAIAALEAS